MSDFLSDSGQNAYDQLADQVDGNATHGNRMNEGRILPRSLQQFLLNRFFEIFGLLTIILVLFAAIAIVSWSPSDPSLNHATSDIVQNSLGLTGAYLSDFLIQTFGAAVIFLFIPILLMGINLTRHHIVQRPILRVIAWVFAGCFIAGALSALPLFGAWPLKTGFGGISGDVTFKTVADMFGDSASSSAIVWFLSVKS